MRSWFAENLEIKMVRLQQIRSSLQFSDQLESMDLYGKFAYACENPAALLDLTFSKTVSIAKLKNIFAIVHESTKLSSAITYIHGTELLELLSDFESALSKIDPKLNQEVCDWFIRQIGELSVMQLIKAIQILKENPHNWPALKSKLKFELKNYDWFKSPPLKTMEELIFVKKKMEIAMRETKKF